MAVVIRDMNQARHAYPCLLKKLQIHTHKYMVLKDTSCQRRSTEKKIATQHYDHIVVVV